MEKLRLSKGQGGVKVVPAGTTFNQIGLTFSARGHKTHESKNMAAPTGRQRLPKTPQRNPNITLKHLFYRLKFFSVAPFKTPLAGVNDTRSFPNCRRCVVVDCRAECSQLAVRNGTDRSLAWSSRNLFETRAWSHPPLCGLPLAI